MRQNLCTHGVIQIESLEKTVTEIVFGENSEIVVGDKIIDVVVTDDSKVNVKNATVNIYDKTGRLFFTPRLVYRPTTDSQPTGSVFVRYERHTI